MNFTILVAGDRRYTDYTTFSGILKDHRERWPFTRIVTGDATGADTMALQWAVQNAVDVTVFCASKKTFDRLIREGIDARLVSDWDRDGKAAGHMRNRAMVVEGRPTMALVFDGGGPGSANMLWTAMNHHVETERWIIDWKGTGTLLATEDNQPLQSAGDPG